MQARTVTMPAALLAVVLGAGVDVGRAQAPAATEGPHQGVYWDGKLGYRTYCASCHGFDLTDGEMAPPIKGLAFMARWQDRAALLTYIQDRMPPGGGRSLSPKAYDDITTYVVAENEARPRTAGGDPAVIAARKARLDALTPVTDEMLANPPDGDWLIWRRTYQQLGFSNLKQIDKSNVAGLQLAWTWNLPESENGLTPLVHDNVMFISGGNQVMALDAVTGDLLWQYTRPLPPSYNSGRHFRGPRGYGIHQDKLFLGTPDRHLIALDIRTGALAWDLPVADQYPDVRVSSAPLVVRGKVIVGVSGGYYLPGGNFILAADAATGKEVWRFHTVAQPGETGGNTWNGAAAESRYGGGVWTGASYDTKRNLVLVGASPTYTTGTLLQPSLKKGHTGDGLFTDATLALDPDTGKLVWYYQHLNRDVWDTDWAFERTLATLTINGRPREVVMTAGKPGIFDVLDVANGQYLFSKDMGLQTLISAIDPKTGRKTISETAKPEWGKTRLVCGFIRNWPATAFNPGTRILYVPLSEGGCTNFTWQARSPEAIAKGGFDFLFEPAPRPNSEGYVGRFQAINMETGKVVWTRRERASSASSLLGTAGGLVFAGSGDRRFRALDESSGDVLWEARLNAAPRSSPVTYQAEGQQYVAVVSGPGGGNGAAPANLTVSVFKLPGSRR